jgi:chromosomal replication initiator protein
MHRTPLTFARFVPVPENRSALLATQDLAEALCSGEACLPDCLLFLHGPTGTGKTHLVAALVEEVARRRPELTVTVLAAHDLARGGEELPADGDLLVVEDLQHLPPRAFETLVQLVDSRQAHGRPLVLTANAGPQQLGRRGQRFPARLVSRLAAGLVVRLGPLQPSSRLALLEELARSRQPAVGPDVLGWLAGHLTGGTRQLAGALKQVEALARVRRRVPDVAEVAEHFRVQAEASAVTVEQIARRVGGYFQVEPEQLQSRRRYRNVLLPRQVGMYLARQLTTLSLGQIGAYFGGRDHSTVLHACRKVEQALDRRAALSEAVRQLHADLV